MFPWFWFHPIIHFPYSGDVTQDIAPSTVWDLPFSGPYAGKPPLERRIMAEAAGYGKQLGILHAALIELIDAQNLQGEAAKETIQLREKIVAIKEDYYRDAAIQAREALEKLQETDIDAYQTLLGELSQTSKNNLFIRSNATKAYAARAAGLAQPSHRHFNIGLKDFKNEMTI